jgi:hypothetical protein
MRIQAKVPARDMLRDAYENYKFGPVEGATDVRADDNLPRAAMA